MTFKDSVITTIGLNPVTKNDITVISGEAGSITHEQEQRIREAENPEEEFEAVTEVLESSKRLFTAKADYDKEMVEIVRIGTSDRYHSPEVTEQ